MEKGLVGKAGELEECASSSVVTPNMLASVPSHSSGSEAASSALYSARSEGSEAASSVYHSARSESLSELQRNFGNQLKFDVESSRPHWTETTQSSAVSGASDDSDELQEPNSVVFERMKEDPHWGLFFKAHRYELEIGAKIAEGGQAEIFEAVGRNKFDPKCAENGGSLVLKVFKKGYSLVDLQRSWPRGAAPPAIAHRYFARQMLRPWQHATRLCSVVGVHVMDDGRFAFIFDRHWGDLRKRIDNKIMLGRSWCSQVFDNLCTCRIIGDIARGMCELHELGILHNDLKAANVLVPHEVDLYGPFLVADFESSVGIQGTAFWRAPEVLEELISMKKERREFRHEVFTQKTDVYNFAMTCYEVITGKTPFGDKNPNDYDMIVVRRERPTLPDYSLFNDLVTKCWHHDPGQRPSFPEIEKEIKRLRSFSDSAARAETAF